MAEPNPFKKPPLAMKGDEDPDSLSLAVGQALSAWEHAEARFSHLFGTIIRPIYNSYAARRAYGSIASARGRREILEAVAEVFFRNFPDTDTQEQMRVLLNHYTHAGARRNEFAHGIIGSDKGEDGKSLGWFIVPAVWNSNKRDIDSGISYRYPSKEIHKFQILFNDLGGRAIFVADAIDGIFQASPETLRNRW